MTSKLLICSAAGLALFIFFSGCLSSQAPAAAPCASGVYEAANNTCCSYVCNTTCAAGYKQSTCRCECLPSQGDSVSQNKSSGNSSNSSTLNLSSIFDEPSSDLVPPLPGASR